MMNKLTLSKGKALVCLILVCLFFVQGCRKDILQPNSGVLKNSLSIAEAKAYFDANLRQGTKPEKLMSTTGAPRKELTIEDVLANKQPIWDKAYEKMLATGGAVKMPIDFGDAYAVINKKKNEVVPLSSLNYLFMYKDSLQAIHAEWVILTPDSAWFYGNRSVYTGSIIVKDWDGKTIKNLLYHPIGSASTSANIKGMLLSSNGKIQNAADDNTVTGPDRYCIRVSLTCPHQSPCTDTWCDMCLNVCAKEFCSWVPTCSPSCDIPGEPGTGGGGGGGGGGNPSAPGGGGAYPPDDCGGGGQIPRGSTGSGVPSDANSIPVAPCIPKPVRLKMDMITNFLGITDPDEQNLLLANENIYDAVVTYLVINGYTPENLDFVDNFVNALKSIPKDDLDALTPSLQNDLLSVNTSLKRTEFIKLIEVYKDINALSLTMNSPSFDYLNNNWLYEFREINRRLEAITATLALIPGWQTNNFINDHIEKQFKIALLATAVGIYPGISPNMTETQKQAQFNTNANNSVAIMLMEFAMGTGLNERNFVYTQPITQQYLENGNLEKVRNEFYKVINEEHQSYNDLKSRTTPLPGRMNYSPDQAGLRNSINAHFNSNLSQFFISGTDVFFTPSADDGWVDVRVYNETTKRSLMLHLGTNYGRNPLPPNRSLSTISQNYKFTIKIDKSKINKQ